MSGPGHDCGSGRQMVWLQIVVAGNVNKNGTHVSPRGVGAAAGGMAAGTRGNSIENLTLGNGSTAAACHTECSRPTSLVALGSGLSFCFYVLTSVCNLPLVVCMCVCLRVCVWLKMRRKCGEFIFNGPYARNCLRRARGVYVISALHAPKWTRCWTQLTHKEQKRRISAKL